MRSWLIIAAVLGLAACAAATSPPEAGVDAGWRTAAGTPLSAGEIDALSRSCTGSPHMTPIDTDRPMPDPLHENRAYHPGGEGLANAPPVGIAAPDRPIEPGTRRIAGSSAEAVAQCLAGKGLIRAQ
jgi:hypothetical protein